MRAVLLRTPAVAVQFTAPLSKPGLSSRFVPPPPPPPPPPQVGSAAWAGTLTASQAALTVLNCVQLPGNRLMAACSVQVRYRRYEAPVVFNSIALYMILIAFCGPRPTTVVPLQVGLVGCPLVGLEPSASR